MELFYNHYGESGPPLIILHGLLGANGNWHTLSRTEFQKIAQVYAVDQRNHGRSPHSDRIDYPSMAADLRDFIDEQDVAPADLLGHSMGGKTAMQAALTYPGRISRLVVVDIAPREYPPQHRIILNALDRIDPRQYGSRDEVDAALADDISSWQIRQFLLKNLDYDGETYSWKMNLSAIRAHYDDITAAIQSDTTFDGPTLFIRGGESDYIADEDMEDIERLFPRAELVTIDGSGHWVHAEAPQEFATVVTDFLKETKDERQ